MASTSNSQLTTSDRIVLDNLTSTEKSERLDDHATSTLLANLNDYASPEFEPVVFTNWDLQHLRGHLPNWVNNWILLPYLSWAQTVVRRKTDVVFLTHILLYLTTAVPSAVYLFFHFSWPHAIAHWLTIGYYCGPFTLLLHNHIHNNGVLAARYSQLDRCWPYILEPLMGHTWDSYYYHHVKHHHVENNGPDDLSSTIRYQRDSAIDFGIYVGRFLLLIWIELPWYFIRKHKPDLALRTAFGEWISYAVIYCLATINFRATMFVLILPLVQMRIGMMVGNWGQHAFVDHEDPQSDFRSSITLIDVASNRHCFNDGWHTAHHLNPRRHWRDHPLSFIKAKSQYETNGALIFRDIDYLAITWRLLRKEYDILARCLVPIGEDQKGMNHAQKMDMLKSKTKRFDEEDVRRVYGNGKEKIKGVVGGK